MINLSVGMLGSIMVASPEAMVIDDDMCGAILRSVRGIEVSDETLDLDAIASATRTAARQYTWADAASLTAEIYERTIYERTGGGR